ncbi:MAG: RimK family alpha-L-glutamate ligase, partial [Candidatus Gallimonas sp.]
DVRVIVVGGRAIGSMLRVSERDFRSNAELGGRGEPYELSEEGKTLCEKIARILRLDYCGIDLLFGKESFLLCEVNSNAFFGAFERVTGINAARAYAEHIERIIYGGKE